MFVYIKFFLAPPYILTYPHIKFSRIALKLKLTHLILRLETMIRKKLNAQLTHRKIHTQKKIKNIKYWKQPVYVQSNIVIKKYIHF